jgi:hypothetical protein
MSKRFDNADTGVGRRRQRSRLRGMLTGKTGKTAGLASIAAPIIGYVVHDLKKPDSIIRGLIGKTISRFLPAKPEKVEAIDITDEVEILEDHSDRKSQDKLSN